jgi:hypothetical protein
MAEDETYIDKSSKRIDRHALRTGQNLSNNPKIDTKLDYCSYLFSAFTSQLTLFGEHASQEVGRQENAGVHWLVERAISGLQCDVFGRTLLLLHIGRLLGCLHA